MHLRSCHLIHRNSQRILGLASRQFASHDGQHRHIRDGLGLRVARHAQIAVRQHTYQGVGAIDNGHEATVLFPKYARGLIEAVHRAHGARFSTHHIQNVHR